MEKTKVDKLMKLRDDLGKLVTGINPEHAAEWECLEKLTSAHKTLRGIDCAELLQLTMPLMTVTEVPKSPAEAQEATVNPPDPLEPHTYAKSLDGSPRGVCRCGLSKDNPIHHRPP